MTLIVILFILAALGWAFADRPPDREPWLVRFDAWLVRVANVLIPDPEPSPPPKPHRHPHHWYRTVGIYLGLVEDCEE